MPALYVHRRGYVVHDLTRISTVRLQQKVLFMTAATATDRIIKYSLCAVADEINALNAGQCL